MMAAVTVGESISFDKVAAIYDATRGGLERGIRFAAAIEPFCGPGPVFEIGVGTGAIAKPLRDRSGAPCSAPICRARCSATPAPVSVRGSPQ